jgi:hypothetical protein
MSVALDRVIAGCNASGNTSWQMTSKGRPGVFVGRFSDVRRANAVAGNVVQQCEFVENYEILTFAASDCTDELSNSPG